MFIFINGLVLYNAVQHNPGTSVTMPTTTSTTPASCRRACQHSRDETREFFSPPLPYLLPSLVNQVCRQVVTSVINPTCDFAIGKSGQLMNVLLSLGVTSPPAAGHLPAAAPG